VSGKSQTKPPFQTPDAQKQKSCGEGNRNNTVLLGEGDIAKALSGRVKNHRKGKQGGGCFGGVLGGGGGVGFVGGGGEKIVL